MKEERFWDLLRVSRYEALFLLTIYLASLYLRLAPRLEIDAHLLTFQGDIWYRLCMAQFIRDNWALPSPDIRYDSYGFVPMWYPFLSPIFFTLASYVTGLDIPTVSSRVVPFIESIAPLSIYFLARYFYSTQAAIFSTIALALTPSFVFWSGISDPQSITLFLIPLLVLAWVWHAKQKASNKRLLAIGATLAFTFMLHLSYFIEVIVLLFVTITLAIKKEAGKKLFFDWVKVVLISQVLTLPWWLGMPLAAMPDSFSLAQKNLYWWWINALVTSSGMYQAREQLVEYGTLAALLGLFSYAYASLFGRRHAVILLWALPLILETQNETIFYAIHRSDLTWSTLAKPLEGFRFYCFLAQPFALAIGVFLSDAANKIKNQLRLSEPAVKLAIVIFLLLSFSWSLQQYDIFPRFQNSGLTVEEYEAALWYRANSQPGDRLAADYYRAQMFGGVSAGRVLQGGEFPLRNVDYAYIKAPGQVLNDLFILYNTSDAELAYRLAKRYNVTHVFYSGNMISYGNLLSYYKPASQYGVDTNKEKFNDKRFFEVAYRKDSPYGEVVILRVK